MSSILKALKKLEEEKNVRRPGSVAIDADILKPETSKPRFSASGMVILAMLIFGGGSVATYFVMMRVMPPQQITSETKYGKEKQMSSPVPATARSGAPSATSTLPTEILPTAVVVVPSSPSAARIKSGRTTPTRPPVVVSPSFSPSFSPSASRVAERQATPSKPSSGQLPPPQQHLQSASTLPSPPAGKATAPRLRVNGIAFQKGSSDNMAIINGAPTSNGSAVEGATVEEIQKDRVRFSFHGELFEIPLGQSNR